MRHARDAHVAGCDVLKSKGGKVVSIDDVDGFHVVDQRLQFVVSEQRHEGCRRREFFFHQT